MNKLIRSGFLMAIMCKAFAGQPAMAQDTQRWIGPADSPQSIATSWFDERNWVNLTPPTGGDTALLGWDPSFNTDQSTLVYFGDFRQIGGNPLVQGGAAVVDDLQIQSGNFIFDMRSFNVSGGQAGSLSTTNLRVGTTVESTGLPGTASLRIQGGDVSTGLLSVGFDNESTGHFILDGVNMNSVQGGFFDNGTADIINGGVLESGSSGSVASIGGGGGTATATVDGPGSRWSVLGNQVWLAHSPNSNGGSGTLNVFNGAQFDSLNAVLLGSSIDGAGGTGHVAVSGLNSTMTIAPTASLILHGQSSVFVSNGGRLEAGGYFDNHSGSSATVSGSGSILALGSNMLVGREGSGIMRVDLGADVSARFATAGDSGTGNGRIEVDGTGSTLTVDARVNNPSGELSIGRSGFGVLAVTNGGSVNARFANAGAFSTGNGRIEVDGTGSTLTVSDAQAVNPSGELSIGRDGFGVLAVTNGGSVNARFANAGVFSNGNGLIQIAGAGSQLNIDEFLVVGSELGLGRIEAINGGVVNVGVASTGGSIFVDDGDELFIDQTSTAIVGHGTSQMGSLVIGAVGQLVGTGTITGDVVNEAGFIGAGFSPGTLTINGNLSLLSDAFMITEIGLFSDSINVSGNALLGGTLQVSDLGDIVVLPGDKFAFLTATSITGSFGNFIDTTSYGFEISINGGTASLVATVPSPGAASFCGTCAIGGLIRRRRRS